MGERSSDLPSWSSFIDKITGAHDVRNSPPRIAPRALRAELQLCHWNGAIKYRTCASIADLAGLPLITSSGDRLNRHLSSHKLRLYQALLGDSRRLRPQHMKLIILKLANNSRLGQPAV
jgi:hypothetical protein